MEREMDKPLDVAGYIVTLDGGRSFRAQISAQIRSRKSVLTHNAGEALRGCDRCCCARWRFGTFALVSRALKV